MSYAGAESHIEDLAQYVQTPERLAEFWSKVDKSGDCWIWTPAPLSDGTKRQRYGKFSISKSVSVRAHRLSYELAKGPIPRGLLVRHTCDNPRCVNPSHLLVGTNQDNMRDAYERGRFRPNAASMQTHCKYGHEFTEANTLRRKANPSRRQCRACLYNRINKRRRAVAAERRRAS